MQKPGAAQSGLFWQANETFEWFVEQKYTGTPPLTRFSYTAVFYLTRFFP